MQLIGGLALPGDRLGLRIDGERENFCDRHREASALDWIADSGSAAAVEKIESLRDSEQGRRIWNEFRPVAMVTLGRLQARAEGN